MAIPATSFSLTANDWYSLARSGLTWTAQASDQAPGTLDNGIVTRRPNQGVACAAASVTFTVDRTQDEALIGAPYGPRAITITGKWSHLYRQ